ncbi:MAG: replication-associated recombination protein A [Clostridiales bacterium]|nr:replication-associated recombination protein A [Clostridiales bacterium]
MDLFDFMHKSEAATPLAERMRPTTLKEFVGQSHLISPTSMLSRAIMMDRLGSCIFWGPPGCGKTTLANVIANSTQGNFAKLNAVSSGVADVKKVVEEAENNLKMFGKKTYLLLDECHRFNKAQSDSLLPAVEKGTIIFIGSTTENPYASMTGAIVSRCRVFRFERLTGQEIKGALQKALKDEKKGLGNYTVEMEDAALNHIVFTAGGDLRSAYGALEMAVLTTPPDKDGVIRVTLRDAEESSQKKALSVDETLYYDVLSAFCKSLRGSDSNAALYYAQRLVEGGCDPLLVARRLLVHSAEDVGMADPQALVVAQSAYAAFEKLGLPEGMIPLSAAIIYVCEAPKSNAVVNAMYAAKEDAQKTRDDGIPMYLRDVSYKSKEEKKEKNNYKYPHNYGGYVRQQYLPDSLKDRQYYQPTDNGFEAKIKAFRKEKETFIRSQEEQ